MDKVKQADTTKINMDIGVRYPAHTTALGKVLLSFLPTNELAVMFAPDEAGKKLRTPMTVRPNLMNELAR